MRRSLLIGLLCSSSLIAAQTKTPVNRLNQCQDSLQEANTARWTLVGTNVDLQLKNKDLQTQNAELAKKYEELRTAAKDVLVYTQTLDGQYKKMLDDYRSLLADYKGSIERQSASDWAHTANANNFARQQSFNNALLLYQAMPKPTFTPLPPPIVYRPVEPAPVAPLAPINSLHCVSNTILGSTYTNCN